jgi:hypothetical protein
VMDRVGFLSTLPFIVPLQSRTWPPVFQQQQPESTCVSSPLKQAAIVGISEHVATNTTKSSSNVTNTVMTTNATTAAVTKLLIGTKDYNNLHSTFVVSIEIRNSYPHPHDRSEGKGHEAKDPREESYSLYRPAFFYTTNHQHSSEQEHPTLYNGNVNSRISCKKDPSLSTFELAFLQQHKQEEDSVWSRAYPNSDHSTTGYPSTVTSTPLVCMRINEQFVFLLDMHQCSHIEIVPSSTTLNHEQQSQKLPCSLILQFQKNIIFRIFAMNDSSRSTNDFDTDDDVLGIFQSVQCALQNIFGCNNNNCNSENSHQKMKRMQIMNIPINVIANQYRLADPNSGGTSPGTTTNTSPSTGSTSTSMDPNLNKNISDSCTSSANTSKTLSYTNAKKRPMQESPSLADVGDEKCATTPNDNRINKTTTIIGNDLQASDQRMIPHEHRNKIQRHSKVLTNTLTNMESIRQIVFTPISSLLLQQKPHVSSPDKNNDNNCNDDDNDDTSTAMMINDNTLSLHRLLNTTAQHMSKSYISNADRIHFNDMYDTSLQQNQQQIDTLLNTFFPSVPSHQERKRFGRRDRLSHDSPFVQKVVGIRPQQPSNPPDAIHFERNSNPQKNEQLPLHDPSFVATATATVQDALQATEKCTQLLQERKRIVQERYNQLLLPTRG